MSVVGIGQGTVNPVPVSKPTTPEPRQFAPTSGAGATDSKLTAQQFASNSGSTNSTSRSGQQPLNASGRGQLVNIIV
jgi:hypothetical protein